MQKKIIICSTFSSTLVFFICTFPLFILSTYFQLVSFSSSIKIRFSFWFDSPIFHENITYLEGEIRNKYIFCQNKGYAYLCYENQFKHLQEIFLKLKKYAMCWKNTMQMCKWNAMFKTKMQFVKLNLQCPNKSCTQQINTRQPKLSKKTWIIKTRNKSSTNKHLEKKTNSPSNLA